MRAHHTVVYVHVELKRGLTQVAIAENPETMDSQVLQQLHCTVWSPVLFFQLHELRLVLGSLQTFSGLSL